MIERLNPPALQDPSEYGYVQATLLPPNARLSFISGQLGDGPDGERLHGFEAQVERAFANLGHALEAMQAAPADVAKITLLVVDHTQERLAIVSRYRQSFFGEARPASTLIPVPCLASDWMQFEIDANVVVLS
ncbi:RidA family protein [Nereida sp. MMG024]|nr:RidA family protein [Nereida sp. MMG025]